MKSIKTLKSLLKKQKPYLKEKYKVKSIAIFGSYSRSEESESSDVDILVDFRDSPGLEFVDLAEELEKILEIKVDLVSKNGAKPKYLNQIEQDLMHV